MIVLAILLLSAAPDGRTPYEKAVSSTVWIESGDGHGTGIFVGERLILTAYHVIESKPSVRRPLRSQGGRHGGLRPVTLHALDGLLRHRHG